MWPEISRVLLLPVFGISPNVGNMTASLPNGLFTGRPSSNFSVRIEDTNVTLWM